MRRVGFEPTSPFGQCLLRASRLPSFATAACASIVAAPSTGMASSRPASLEVMCGRYTLTNADPAVLRARFGIEESAKLEEEEPRFNIAPTDPVLAIRRT